ncbi:MAG: DUF4876 domain-containing protein [Alistipes sp.]
MKKILSIIAGIAFVACTSFPDDPYADDLQQLTVQAVYPENYTQYLRAGVTVLLQDVNFGNRYTAQTDNLGLVTFRVANGIYRVAISDIATEETMFNGMADRVQVIGADRKMPINLQYSKPGSLIIKEIYCGGCSKAPEQGEYMMDKYVILHNNSPRTIYLDGLCFGFADPYNSSGAENKWVTKDPVTGETIFPPFVPILDGLWQFGGGGTDFPVESGEDAVIAINGAINHEAQYPLSVNLNKPDYFVCYDEEHYPLVSYHPTPGDQIQQSHHLRVVIKLGKGTGYGFSTSSPATVIFRPIGTTIDEFVKVPSNVVQKPGASSDKCVLVPQAWIIDGVEVFTKASDPVKRLQPIIDAGFVVFSESKKGHTLHRLPNEGASAAAGFEMYTDTNNSSNDFQERATQSLHE